MWRADESDFDQSWFNHSEECDESRMFFKKVKDQTDKAILFEHPQGYDFWIPKSAITHYCRSFDEESCQVLDEVVFYDYVDVIKINRDSDIDW